MRQVNRISPNINKIGKMILKELLKAIQPVQIAGDPNIEITGINIDSRRVEDGHLFMAMRGTQTDGHAYIAAAIAKGAVAILCEEIPESRKEGVTYVRSEEHTSELQSRQYLVCRLLLEKKKKKRIARIQLIANS